MLDSFYDIMIIIDNFLQVLKKNLKNFGNILIRIENCLQIFHQGASNKIQNSNLILYIFLFLYFNLFIFSSWCQ